MTALTVSQATLVQNLQQNVEDVWMCLLNLIKEQDRVWATANSLGELAALIVAHISWRRTNQLSYGVTLHVLGHVVRKQGVFGAKQELCQGFCKLSLTYARRAKEDERAARTLRVFERTAASADCLCNLNNSLVLTNNALVKYVFCTK